MEKLDLEKIEDLKFFTEKQTLKNFKNEFLEYFEIIEEHINKKWFFVFQIKKEIIGSNFKKLLKPTLKDILKIFLIIFLITLTIYFYITIDEKIIILVLYLFWFFAYYSIKLFLNFGKDVKNTLITEKNDYIPWFFKTDLMILENVTFINGKIFKQNYKNISENNKILNEMNINSKMEFFSINSENKIFFKLRKNFLKLEFLYQFLDTLILHIEDEIEERKNWIYKDRDLENAFLKFDEKVKQIYEIKDEILKIVWEKKSHYFNISKFENWIKEKLIFSLNSLKNILKNNLESCVLQLEENKKLENPQIILANKRLEIQKILLEIKFY